MAELKPKDWKYWVTRRYSSEGKVDTSDAPDWWVSSSERAKKLLNSLNDVDVFELGKSAGGRSIIGGAIGEKEDVPGRTSSSLCSAISGGSTAAFYGEKRRERQTFLFVGAAHGTEFEGSVAALNMLNVIATGKDLRGKSWPRMAEEGRKQRVIVIPFLNVDGRDRYSKCLHHLDVLPEDYQLVSQGRYKNGERLKWPTSKLVFPLPVEKLEIVGSYYNDNGVNLVYDIGMGKDTQPETQSLIKYLQEELPDCALCSHTNNGSLVEPPASFMPTYFRQRIPVIGGIVGARCKREGMTKFRIPERVESYAGQAFYQTDMIYHVSGALPLLVEFPCGYQNVPNSLDEVLDNCMYVLEEILAFGNTYGYIPPMPK